MFKRSRKDSSLLSNEGLEIDVHKDVLTMYGTSSESVGCVLRGTLRFHLIEPMKVKSISLRFLGRVKLGDGADFQCQEIDLIDHKWTFLESEQDPYLLAPSNYRYNFELPLPGNLPESVEVPHGSVSYKLMAFVERPAFRNDFKAEKGVDIQRAPLPSTDEYLQPTMVSGIWAERLGYYISTPDTIYTVGDTFPVMFSLLSLDPYFCMIKTTVVLREFVTYNVKNSKPILKQYDLSRASAIASRKQELSWDGALNLEIPKRTLYDCETDYIRVFHKFFVEIEVMEVTGEIQVLHVLLKVGVQSNLQNELAQSPPEYEPISGFSDMPPPPYNRDHSSLVVV
ncbi:hypothetical protein K493DRAFT_371274 [Basidiobolus meristosporus CBS 931.73]|uniref:Arrestin-like N-terminal domain-containing protein n=1 Tax=Basidiobolus meristosporus CBS 931.73 TaxID=1314790 RepID=A0A1Y1Z839_9FUNG|nr:hypothetical protein K493DRAFT_371274 [Basidiobolus meristosporus CBS 931.73]|eukprot:ORY06430.1 hypothetical protein K493DRAFT_371274 [Basidiobolus meristosporus CBS 931.73]